MAHINGYFFNAQINEGGQYDRLYNNEDFCGYLAQLIGNGVFPTPQTQLQVSPKEGMTVKVNPGQGWIEGHKMILEEDIEGDFTLTVPSVLLEGHSRTDRVVFRVNYVDRVMEIVLKSDLENETTPGVTRNSDYYELSLALISVKYGITEITESMIADTRGEAEVCGWVAGLIEQIDVSGVASQYVARYQEILNDMESWYATLTQDLTVGAYLVQYHKVVQVPASNIIYLDMEDYVYNSHDLLTLTLNGLRLSPGVDYYIVTSSTPVSIRLATEITSGNTLDILAVKSSLEPSSGGLVTYVMGQKFVYIPNALPNENVKKMWINTLGVTNKFAVAGRNLIRFDRFDDYTSGDLTFELLSNGKIGIGGTSGSSPISCVLPIDISTFRPGEKYTLSIAFDGISDTEDVGAGVLINGTTGYVVDYATRTITFEIPETLTSIALDISVSGVSVPVSGSVALQLEYGAIAHDFVKAYYDEYTYDGNNTPMLNDGISNIWILDSSASGLKVGYFVMDSVVDGDSLYYPIENS